MYIVPTVTNGQNKTTITLTYFSHGVCLGFSSGSGDDFYSALQDLGQTIIQMTDPEVLQGLRAAEQG
jgi:hypothetical protein